VLSGLIGVHRNIGTPVARVDVDVTIKVSDVEQLFDVVSGDVALFFELRPLVASTCVRSRSRGLLSERLIQSPMGESYFFFFLRFFGFTGCCR
jgi:hypothetical protein